MEDFWPQVHLVNSWKLGAAAVAYATGGLKIFPVWSVRERAEGGGWLCRCPSAELCSEPGKHPLVPWKEGASSDQAVVEAWWRRWPWANIGLALGPSNLVVVDLDQHEHTNKDTGEIRAVDGRDSLDAWLEDAELAQADLETFQVNTGGGGSHLFFQAPADGEGKIKNCNGWLPSVDVKAHGGYVLLAPSVHVYGTRYQNGAGRAPAVLPPKLEKALRAAVQTGSGGAGKGPGSYSGVGGGEGYDYARFKLDGPPEGHRDMFFNAYAFELRRSGVTRKTAEAKLRSCWEKVENKDTFPWEMALGKLNRVFDGGSDDVGVDEDKNPSNVVALQGWVKGLAANGGGGGESGSLALSMPNPKSQPNVEYGELLTERAAADRFIALNRNHHLKITGADWYSWDYERLYWAPDVDGGAARTFGVKRVVDSYKAEQHVPDGGDEERLVILRRWINKLESRVAATAIIRNAADDPTWRVDPEHANVNPWILQLPGAMVEIRVPK